jgi:hypothetical protein
MKASVRLAGLMMSVRQALFLPDASQKASSSGGQLMSQVPVGLPNESGPVVLMA